MVSKKSQVTVFVILGIVLVGGLLVFFLARDSGKIDVVSPEVEPVYNFVLKCLDKVSNDAVYEVMNTGGYYDLPELVTDNHVAYYYYEERSYVPSKEDIEMELESYMNDLLPLCIKNFEELPDYEVDSGEVDSEVEIEDDRVEFEVSYRLSIKKGENSYSFERFGYVVQIRLGLIIEAVREMIDLQLETPDDICLNCLTDVMNKYDLEMDLYEYKDDAIIFYVLDKENEVNQDVGVFVFANRYES
ncbi:hypothetical protein CMI38_00475 [Candidatus Pacearchaeota archaeon]|nr:hypothetical protein [Candidatus Pacearchaeota archaeon]|tara:strand:- start:263 stop:997 length:735 start_codon:yes stop_codon:yes gene_type:complete